MEGSFHSMKSKPHCWLGYYRRALFVGIAVLAGIVNGCRSEMHSSIRYRKTIDGLITNGTAFDRAELPLDRCAHLVVPVGAVITHDAKPGTCVLRIEKTLNVLAHPVRAISIVEQRKEMGCALLRSADSLLVSTFGEFATPGHGGATVRLSVSVPSNVQVDVDETLAGPDSQANRFFELKEQENGKAQR